jgi:hypothetical protein
VYRLLDADQAISHVESETAHGYQQDKREHLYEAVERWLNPPFPCGRAEVDARLESFEQLRCGLPEENRTFRDIYASWLQGLPRASPCPNEGELPGLRAFLSQRLGLPEPPHAVSVKRTAAEAHDNVSAEFYVFEPEPGIRLPAVLIETKPSRDEIVLVPGRNKQAVGDAIRAGRRVFAFDPRGTGEMADGGGRFRNFAWFAGRPLVGMWVLDIQQAARLLKQRFPEATVRIDARDRFAWPALLAGAAEPGLIRSGTVRLELSSLHELIRRHGDAALADVPGLLDQLDIPQIRALWPEVQTAR